jgi:CRP-like cAMP-binding protein
MPHPEDSQTAIENLILATLPQKRYSRLFARLQPVSLNARQIVYEQGRPIRFIYFPATAMVSLISMSQDRKKGIEVNVVGHEGILGLPIGLGGHLAVNRALVQLAGLALRVETNIFEEALAQDGPLKSMVERYALFQLAGISRSVGCNCFHKLEARLARWLLVTHDHARADTFHLTQEFAATLLGAHRPAISLAANSLQTAKLISYSHGKVQVLNRQKLEAIACECYAVIREEYTRLFGDLSAP